MLSEWNLFVYRGLTVSDPLQKKVLTLIGMQGVRLADKLKPEAKAVISVLREAGKITEFI